MACKEEVGVTAFCCKGQGQEGRQAPGSKEGGRKEGRCKESGGEEGGGKEGGQQAAAGTEKGRSASPEACPATEGSVSRPCGTRSAHRPRAEHPAGPDGAGGGDLRQRERGGAVRPHRQPGSRAPAPAPGARRPGGATNAVAKANGQLVARPEVFERMVSEPIVSGWGRATHEATNLRRSVQITRDPEARSGRLRNCDRRAASTHLVVAQN